MGHKQQIQDEREKIQGYVRAPRNLYLFSCILLSALNLYLCSFSLLPAFNMERVMGIEPTPSAWKAEVLPLNYTRQIHYLCTKTGVLIPATPFIWWRGEDLNLRRLSRQIYSLIPLTTREPLQKCKPAIVLQTCLGVNNI